MAVDESSDTRIIYLHLDGLNGLPSVSISCRVSGQIFQGVCRWCIPWLVADRCGEWAVAAVRHDRACPNHVANVPVRGDDPR